jgi:hypothetical protein
MVDFKTRKWTLGARVGYVVQLPDSVPTRVSSSSSAREVDPKVARDLGDWYWVSADGDVKLNPRFNFNLEYSYLLKYRDQFRGRSSTGFDYSSLAENSGQELHQTRAGIQYLLHSEGVRGGVARKWLATIIPGSATTA